MWGCVCLSDYLKFKGVSVSSPTIQKILIQQNLGAKYQRLLKLEEKALDEKIPLSPEQVKAIENANPCFEGKTCREFPSGRVAFAGHVSGGCLQRSRQDLFADGSYAFSYLHTGKLPEHAATILHNDVLPQYERWKLPVKAVLTDNGWEYCGKEHHLYEGYLALNEIEHRTKKVKCPQTNGFVERFNHTILDEFFRPQMRTTYYYDLVEKLQKDLNKWLKHYNEERTHQGYRNRGKRPIDTIRQFGKNG